MANQVEGLNGTRSTYVYENIEIVEIDGVRMVRRLKDKKIIGLNSPKKDPQEGYYQRQFNKSQPRYQDLALKEELTQFFQDTGNVNRRVHQRFQHHQLSSCVELCE